MKGYLDSRYNGRTEDEKENNIPHNFYRSITGVLFIDITVKWAECAKRTVNIGERV